MANRKLTELSEPSTFVDGDIIYAVSSPGTSPVSQKMTISKLRDTLIANPYTTLTELDTTDDDDLIYVISDPSGTPVVKQITVASLRDSLFPAATLIPQLNPDVIFDAGYGINVADNQPVVSWSARVGGVTLTQSNASYRPTFLANGIGSEPAVLFDGTQWMTLSNTPLTGSLGTVIVVAEQSDTTGNQCLLSVFWNSVSTDTIRFMLDDGQMQIYHVETNVVTGGTTLTVSTAHALTYTTNAAHDDWLMYVDTALESLTVIGANTGDWITEITDCTEMSVGCQRGAGANPFKGKIAYIAGWNSLL